MILISCSCMFFIREAFLYVGSTVVFMRSNYCYEDVLNCFGSVDEGPENKKKEPKTQWDRIIKMKLQKLKGRNISLTDVLLFEFLYVIFGC